ncbi:MAG: TerC family protein [Deltaproteobacteria bacterium]|nr:MAG: TerC family protein [Deltaproteobacteria bacterium]
MYALLTDPQSLMSLLALAALEIVLGIDNLVFIALMVQRLPEQSRKLAYRLGLGGALVTRLCLLFTLSWLLGLTKPLFTVMENAISGRDLILGLGGAFLMYKSATEMFDKVEHRSSHHESRPSGRSAMVGVVAQIMLIDIIFSLDSVITAVGIAQHLWVMVVAMVSAVAVMMVFAKSVGDFIVRHPSMQILALSFLMLIGVLLVAESFDQHISKGYVYFAMSFSLMVELFNLRLRSKGARLRDAATARVLDEVAE